jgi:glycosyltransferase involved in cell wall biosynthesis
MILNLNCPINQTSYGYVSCNIIKELVLLNHDIRHIPIGQNFPDDELLQYIYSTIQRWDYDYDAPCLKIWHQHDLDAFYGRGWRIGMPIFELEEFNPVELHSLKNPDRLFVCSKWAKNVIESNIPGKSLDTHVVPLGVDQSIFRPCPLPDNTKTIFGNFGKFEVRKGHDVLPIIFNKAFEKNDDVLLVMMPHNPFLSQEETNNWVRSFKNTKLGDKIIFIDRQKHHSMVYNIMSQIHCGIFPARAEGWNLEALELLSCGRHIIITDCTAHTEFCNQDNAMLVDMNSGYEKAKDFKFFDGSMSWRKIGSNEIDQMVEYLRNIHHQNLNGNLQINSAGIATAEKYSWKNTAQTIENHINDFI